MWPSVLEHCAAGNPLPVYDGGRIPGASLAPGTLGPAARRRIHVGVGPDRARLPKHCSFCSVWRTDGQEPRARTASDVVDELRDLRRRGFRFIALADDNFYPITKTDLAMAARRLDKSGLKALEDVREERFELMRQLAELPDDMVFYTQITMEAAEDPEFLDAMRKAHIRGALVGVESVTKEGLKSIYKDFNLAGDALVAQLQKFRDHDIHVLASFIFGLPTDTPSTFSATAELAHAARVSFAQFVLLTPFPGTIDFQKWEDSQEAIPQIDGVPADPALAAAAQETAEDLHAASDDVRRADSPADAGDLGQLLQPAGDLAAIELPALDEGPAGVRADFQALSPDVREHRHRHRQRPTRARRENGASDRQALPSVSSSPRPLRRMQGPAESRPLLLRNRHEALLHPRSLFLLIAIAGLSVAAQTPQQSFTPVTDEMLWKPSPNDWLTWRRTLDSWGYSPLKEIDRNNVSKLKMTWSRGIVGGRTQEATPLVYNGTMYIPNPGDIIMAMDAQDR